MNASIQTLEAASVSSVNNKTQNIINELIATHNDRYEGYINSIKEVTDTHLKDLFTRISLQSKKFSEELKTLVPFINVESQTALSEQLFRAEIYVRTAVLRKDLCRVLSTCEYGEVMVVNNYTVALKEESLSNDIRIILEKQLSLITSNIQDLRGLNTSAC
ncbi:MAG: PA2169 family four-helix-bundle protein [Bacteroidia bacterium]|nr:PA2169 family four-helix-bundle protein [Bacteroidia bacterium]